MAGIKMRTLNDTARCADCKTLLEPIGHSPGCGLRSDGSKLCYACCAIVDADQMDKTGKATLYLRGNLLTGQELTNWPGSLRITVFVSKSGKHNMAGCRTDVWFRFNKQFWHGVQYGENTQLCHCKRVKPWKQY